MAKFFLGGVSALQARGFVENLGEARAGGPVVVGGAARERREHLSARVNGRILSIRRNLLARAVDQREAESRDRAEHVQHAQKDVRVWNGVFAIFRGHREERELTAEHAVPQHLYLLRATLYRIHGVVDL